MNNASQQSGFAIALLLWMIAGMSLTVAAVIHFAYEDTGMAELRVREAKVQALGRGVAYLLLRDSAWQHTGRRLRTPIPRCKGNKANQSVKSRLYSPSSISLATTGRSLERCARPVASCRLTMLIGTSS